MKIPAEIESKILLECKRRCSICFGLNGDLQLKKGQIAHIDENSNNNRDTNLVFLCLDHHDEYDSKTSQSKSITRKEVKLYKEKLIETLKANLNNKTKEDEPDFSALPPDLNNEDMKNVVWQWFIKENGRAPTQKELFDILSTTIEQL